MPGDVILCEEISYPGIIALAHQMHLQLIGVKVDDEGIIPDALEQACRTHQSRLLFCVPTLHNPTTAVMSEARRRAIASIAKKYQLRIVEDTVPGVIVADQPPALAAYLPEQVFMVGSFSKSLAPGLRIGYIHAPEAWLGKLAAVIRANCWMVSPISAEIICRWLDHGVVRSLLAEQRDDNRALQSLATERLRDVHFQRHADGSHLWLPLPANVRTSEFVDTLWRRGVIVKPVDAFTVGRTHAPAAVRLCLSAVPDKERLRKGLDIVAQTLRDGPEGFVALA